MLTTCRSFKHTKAVQSVCLQALGRLQASDPPVHNAGVQVPERRGHVQPHSQRMAQRQAGAVLPPVVVDHLRGAGQQGRAERSSRTRKCACVLQQLQGPTSRVTSLWAQVTVRSLLNPSAALLHPACP